MQQMLHDLESDLTERKESFSGGAPTTVREAVCALANDLPNHRRAGVVFVGAKDDGTPSLLTVTDELLRQLADIKTDGNIVPLPTLTVAKRLLFGAELAVICVEPSDSPPVRYKGRAYIRIGPRRGIASVQDERILNEKRRYGDHPFDIRPVSMAALSDLNQRMFEEEYLPSSIAPDVLASDDRSYEERLASEKMVASADNPTPTVLGLLVIGVSARDFLPGAYIQFLRIAGVELADPIADEQEIDGPVTEVLRRVDEKIAAHNRVAVDFTSGPVESRRPTYPFSALQQLIRNAVLHRTYEATNAPVRVYWYDNRIEITSPGGPFGSVTEANFGVPGITDYRNPNLAAALRVTGFVQHFGAGIPIARRALAENHNPQLEFLIEPTYIGAVVRPSQ